MYTIRKKFGSLSVLSLSLILLIFIFNYSMVHAQTHLPATHDSFVDPNNSNDNYNAGGLELTYSNFGSFAPTRRSLVRFDVSSVTAVTGRSLMVFEVVNNNLPAGASVNASLYKLANDTWDEATVTWANAPVGATTWPVGASDLLQTITVDSGYLGTVTFGSTTIDNLVGAYIEQERLGDGQASFLLVLDSGTSLGFAGNFYFEDSEDTFNSGSVPYIDVRTPTAINLNSFQAENMNVVSWTILGIMILITSVILIVIQQKRKTRLL